MKKTQNFDNFLKNIKEVNTEIDNYSKNFLKEREIKENPLKIKENMLISMKVLMLFSTMLFSIAWFYEKINRNNIIYVICFHLASLIFPILFFIILNKNKNNNDNENKVIKNIELLINICDKLKEIKNNNSNQNI